MRDFRWQRPAARWLMLTSLIAAALPAAADSSPGRAPEGAWQGSIMGLRLVVHVGRGADGALTGTLDSPDQGAMGIAIDTLAFVRDSLRFEMRRMRASYAGALSASGDSIAGEWSQGGLVLPLAFRRLERAPEYRRPQDPVPPYPYDTLEVSYPNAKAGVSLAGTLTLPRGAGPHPCALLITGSGPENRDQELFGHRPFRVLADHLTRKGIAVLRVDDRGVGGSTGDPATATSEDFAGDVLSGIEFLKTRREIDRRRIGLIGHSEGGLIGPMVASRSKDVAFLVLMAGPGIPGDSVMILQSAAARRMLGVDEETLAREAAVSRRLYDTLKRGDSTGTRRVMRELIEVQASVLPPGQRGALGDIDTLTARMSRQLLGPWMRFFLAHDPRPALRRVTCPVLALNGSRDFQVTPKENLAGLRAAFAAGGNRDATVKELPGLNHMFQTATTGALQEYARIEETLAPAALEEISGWIVARTSTTR